jgi:hypothetical protein
LPYDLGCLKTIKIFLSDKITTAINKRTMKMISCEIKIKKYTKEQIINKLNIRYPKIEKMESFWISIPHTRELGKSTRESNPSTRE